jgi:hypothetical protein
MRRTLCWMAAGIVLSAWAAPTWAAHKMVPEEGAVEVMLLLQPSVCKDLNLAPDKREKIGNFADAQWKKAQTLATLDEKQRDERFKEMTKENERFISEVLSKDQKKRLDQILLQTAGLLWVTRPEIAKELNLSAEQKKRAAQLQQEARDEMEQLIHETSDEQKDAKLRELNKTSRDRLMTLLTDEQEAKWKHMMGEPFKGEISFAERKTTTTK